eukprot:3490254-Amphidinium_carterae.2
MAICFCLDLSLSVSVVVGDRNSRESDKRPLAFKTYTHTERQHQFQDVVSITTLAAIKVSLSPCCSLVLSLASSEYSHDASKAPESIKPAISSQRDTLPRTSQQA